VGNNRNGVVNISYFYPGFIDHIGQKNRRNAAFSKYYFLGREKSERNFFFDWKNNTNVFYREEVRKQPDFVYI